MLPSPRIQVIAVEGIPVIDGPSDLPEIILRALGRSGEKLVDGDVIVVAQKIVSKSEGRVVRQSDVQVSEHAQGIAKRNGFDPWQVQLALDESREVLRSERVFITETRNGIVCNFSGVDRSNAPRGSYILLPENPDASAEHIMRVVIERTGLSRLAVIVSDTQGRPWRVGSVNLAIGCAGINAFKYNRGKQDLYGRVLEHSTVCQIDELAAAAEHAMGQAGEGVPVVIVRGYPYSDGPEHGSNVPRPKSEDLFR